MSRLKGFFYFLNLGGRNLVNPNSELSAIFEKTRFFITTERKAYLPHEGNVEQIFSLGGRLSDPNIDPAYLARLVFIGANEKVYMPPVKDIWQRYLKKFSKHGKLLENDAGLEIDEAAGDLDTYTDTVSPVRTH